MHFPKGTPPTTPNLTPFGVENLVLSLIPIGHPDHPRFLIANQNKQFWTGTGWSDVEDHGLLFADEREIGNVATKILTAHCGDKKVFRFTVPVEIEIRSDEPPSIEVVRAWLMRAVRLYVDYHQGQLVDGVGLVSLNLLGLKEVGE